MSRYYRRGVTQRYNDPLCKRNNKRVPIQKRIIKVWIRLIKVDCRVPLAPRFPDNKKKAEGKFSPIFYSESNGELSNRYSSSNIIELIKKNHVYSCGVYGGQSRISSGFSSCTSIFLSQHHSSSGPIYHGR
jgi:hypothetical protein